MAEYQGARWPGWIGSGLWILLGTGMAADDPYAQARERMVQDQIAARGVRNADVLRAMRATPRHEFVPPEVRSLAYRDHPVEIGFEATISQPYVVAVMTELLAPARQHKVLEIGTGSGYQAAVLAQLAGRVYTIEIVPELAASAKTSLARLGYGNVTARQGDGYKGWPEEAPFDRIILTAAPVHIPQALIDQLKPGGRLVAPVGSRREQELTIIEKRPDGKVEQRSAGAISFVPMRQGK
jgi:protein-L-isoaspartate(D-aspartate) O-methyltransferase